MISTILLAILVDRRRRRPGGPAVRIFRYRLNLEDGDWDSRLELRGDVLSVAPAREGYGIDLWALHSEEALPRLVDITVVGTGHPIPDKLVPLMSTKLFQGTCVMPDGLVWHVFALPHMLGEGS